MARTNELPINLDDPVTGTKYINVPSTPPISLAEPKAVAPSSATIQSVQPLSADQQITVANDPLLAKKMDEARVSTSKDPNDAYEFGAANSDPKLLADKASEFKGTLTGQVFQNAADKLTASKKLMTDVSGIDLSSPQGRTDYIKVVDTLSDRDKAREAGYGTIADNPKLGTALVQFLLGDKLGAVASITGGNVKTYTEFNDKGQMRVVKRNDLGEIDSVFDDVGRLITYDQYRKEGGSRPLEHTMAYKIRVLNAEKNATAFAANIDNYNVANSVMSAIGERAKRQEALYPMLKSLTPKQQVILASFTDATVGNASSFARLKNNFDQGGFTVGQTIKAEDARALGAGIDSAIEFKGNNTWTDSVGNTYSSQTLKNKLDQVSGSSNIDARFNKTRENLAREMAIAGLSQEGINALDVYFDLERQNQQDIVRNAKIIPGFIELPTSELKVGDQPTRLLLNSLQAQKGAQKMSEFLDYTNTNYAKERANDPAFTPEPSRYEGAFVNTNTNKRLNAEYNAKALGLISKPAPTVEKELLPGAGTAAVPFTENKTNSVAPPYTEPKQSPSEEQKDANSERQKNITKALEEQKNKAARRAIQNSLKQFKKD